MDLSDILAALGLVLIIEGIGPFFFPNRWREYMLKIAKESPTTLRQIGLSLLSVGLILLIINL